MIRRVNKKKKIRIFDSYCVGCLFALLVFSAVMKTAIDLSKMPIIIVCVIGNITFILAIILEIKRNIAKRKELKEVMNNANQESKGNN